MEKYEVVSLIGEGSFGRVYKVKALATNEDVAFKVIVKRGRSEKELKGLQQECEIQRHLHHPHIIKMIESFETESEIVVVTEFVDKGLHEILGQEGYLPEEQVRKISCDLVSALFYLHKNRVLHRDLKPQNVLIDKNGAAKLCDFGFARSMGTGTHVLTSIKGTPLYMAPELIEGRPYDHKADLWSLGCIVYELLVGSPPFCTSSLLQLVKLVRDEAVQWPEFVSSECRDFLQGLLHKDPEKRLSWPQLLHHAFVYSNLNIETQGEAFNHINPFTVDLTASQSLAKENQRQSLINRNIPMQYPHMYDMNMFPHPAFNVPPFYPQPYCTTMLTPYPNLQVQCAMPIKPYPAVFPTDNKETQFSNVQPITNTSTSVTQSINISSTPNEQKQKFHSSLKTVSKSLDLNEKKLYNSLPSHLSELKLNSKNKEANSNIEKQSEATQVDVKLDKITDQDKSNTEIQKDASKKGNISKSRTVFTLHSWDSAVSARPIENDEWLAFLQKNMEELMGGQLDCLRNHNLVSVVVAPLRNANASSHVLEYVASMLALPFVVDGPSEKDVENIRQVYLEVKVVPNLVYASKIVARNRGYDSESSSPNMISTNEMLMRPVSELSAEELHALECIYLLICHLVHSADDFLIQFCDAAAILNAVSLLQQFLLLGRRKVRVVTDLLAILNLVLRVLPENADVVEQIVLGDFSAESNALELGRLLSHPSGVIRSRTCELIKLLSACSGKAVQAAWTPRLEQDLNALLSDSISSVRMAAEEAFSEMKGTASSMTKSKE